MNLFACLCLSWLAVVLLVSLEICADTFVVPAIDFPINDKLSLSHAELQFFRYSLKTDGIVALSSIPGLRETRRSCLATLGRCYHEGLLRDDLSLILALSDGTKRTTLAPKANGFEEDFGCPGLGKKIRALQIIVDDASKIFAKALDDSLLDPSNGPLFMAFNNSVRVSYKDFSSVIGNGDHLDHFHIYEKRETVDAKKHAQDTLQRHTDQGLFVAIVPAMAVKNGKLVDVADGFEVEVPPSKSPSRIALPNSGDCVLFMVGDGVSNWIDKNSIQPLRSVPHRLIMEKHNGLARAWFGRMFFPPKDAFLPKQQVTFRDLRMKSIETGTHGGDVSYGGCSNNDHVLRDLTGSACGADEIYCWMACRSTVGLTCASNQTIQCVNHRNGQIWMQESEHCFDCSASCYGDASNSDNSSVSNETNTSFCNMRAYPTNMYMDGFNGLGPNVPCLIFLFQSWILDTPTKYAFGSIGAFLIGIAIETLVYFRRQLKLTKLTHLAPSSRKRKVCAFMLILLYGIQLVLAYFAMLLAMSFAIVIFTMVMLGLTTGHFIFNFETPPGNNEACCAANDHDLRQTSPVTVKAAAKPENCCMAESSRKSSVSNEGLAA